MAQRMEPGAKRRMLLGCLVSVVIVAAIGVLASSVAERHGRESSSAAANRLYDLASVQDYPGISGFATKSVVLTLQKAWSVNGALSGWKIEQVSTQAMGRPSQVVVGVTRASGSYVDLLILLDSMHVAVLVEYPKDDWEAGREDRAVRVIAK